ncbi:MAG: hydroxymethylbilane synthase [Gammaproteobacteria bacterium]|nr:hydroxymethylbilane synthase [Gammaproteobacteria bacterium]
MNKTLKLGTRRSLLAIAQSRGIARHIEQTNPGISVELVGIETQGDRILDIPLSKIEGKEFFVAELDKALTDKEVDLTVHSMKDLSLERPDNFTLAAIPERENPRDIMLFANNIIEKLKQGEPIRIGTSSPRRIENLPPFLEKALPNFGGTPKLAITEIRGNVNTRISFLSLPEDDPKKIDGVALAFAGLNRLWADASGRTELKQLLNGLRWMLLPIRECPTAPAQGALAIECRSADTGTRALLTKLHCPSTAQAIEQERQILQDWGGGCHQRFGATVLHFNQLGRLLFIRGRKPDNTYVEELRWTTPENKPATAPSWDGTSWRETSFTSDYLKNQHPPSRLTETGATFIAHSRALPEQWATILIKSPQRIWTSGTSSWFQLAKLGIWVEGSAEEFGFDALQNTLRQELLNLPAINDWNVLTHDAGLDTWPCKHVTSTYSINSTTQLQADHPAVIALSKAQAVFWSSASQFEAFKEWIPEGCQHACRYGKSYYSLINKGLDNLAVYPSAAEWRRQQTQQGAEK